MLKLFFTVAVIAAVYFFFIKKPQVQVRRQKRADASADAPPENDKNEEIMVACEKCGTYVSSKEAIIAGGKYFCSKSCAGVKSC